MQKKTMHLVREHRLLHGAIEAAICALGLHRGWLPPTINVVQPDPACDLDYLADGGCGWAPEFALSNSLGFGGVNACLPLGRA